MDMQQGKSRSKRKAIWEVAEKRLQLKREQDRTRVILGENFERWRALKSAQGLKSDAMVAGFLLDKYVYLFSKGVFYTSMISGVIF